MSDPAGIRAAALASMAITTVLAPVLLTATACATQACAGQCRPPFRLQVIFRQGTSKQTAAAAINKCQHQPLVIRTGQPYPAQHGTSGQWTAIIYTTTMPSGPAHIPLLTCLHHSPAVLTAGWPD